MRVAPSARVVVVGSFRPPAHGEQRIESPARIINGDAIEVSGIPSACSVSMRQKMTNGVPQPRGPDLRATWWPARRWPGGPDPERPAVGHEQRIATIASLQSVSTTAATTSGLAWSRTASRSRSASTRPSMSTRRITGVMRASAYGLSSLSGLPNGALCIIRRTLDLCGPRFGLAEDSIKAPNWRVNPNSPDNAAHSDLIDVEELRLGERMQTIVRIQCWNARSSPPQPKESPTPYSACGHVRR